MLSSCTYTEQCKFLLYEINALAITEVLTKYKKPIILKQ